MGHLRSVLWDICGVSFRICICLDRNSGKQYPKVAQCWEGAEAEHPPPPTPASVEQKQQHFLLRCWSHGEKLTRARVQALLSKRDERVFRLPRALLEYVVLPNVLPLPDCRSENALAEYLSTKTQRGDEEVAEIAKNRQRVRTKHVAKQLALGHKAAIKNRLLFVQATFRPYHTSVERVKKLTEQATEVLSCVGCVGDWLCG